MGNARNELDVQIEILRTDLNRSIKSRNDLKNLCDKSVQLDKLLEKYIRMQGERV